MATFSFLIGRKDIVAERTPEHSSRPSIRLILEAAAIGALCGLSVLGPFALNIVAWSLIAFVLGSVASRRLLFSIGIPLRSCLTILQVSLAVAILAPILRFVIEGAVYGHLSDASEYAEMGVQFIHSARGPLDLDSVRRIPGTGTIDALAGLTGVLVGHHVLSISLIFSLTGFTGKLLFLASARTAFPARSMVPTTAGIFLLPSLWFWPALVGKEGPMLLALGMISLGVARLFERQVGGLRWLVVGGIIGSFIRPHLVLLLIAGICGPLIIRNYRSAGRAIDATRAVALTFLLISALAAAGWATVAMTGFELSQAAVLFERTQDLTATGGSNFQTGIERGGLGILLGGLGSLVRPFIWEAHSPVAFVSGLEMTVLWALLLMAYLRYFPLELASREKWHVAWIASYVSVGALAFGAFSNAGLLARQRIQILPVLLMLIAVILPSRSSRRRPRGGVS